jgi:fatty acid desaturase
MQAEPKSPAGEIDFTPPFFPARFTALHHVPSWHLLEERHRTRYTQLYALYLNEQTAFFEELLATTLLPALYARPDLIGADLAESLRCFEEEERRHSLWFREMNHRIDPDMFSMEPGDYVFIPSSPRLNGIGKWFAGKPFAFPFWIWLILLQEERSIYIAQECLKEPVLEPNFRKLHRRHMADEVGHVRWDTELIEAVWLPMPMWKRKVQAGIFGWLMREFFTVPKRSARAVLDALLGEFPELSPIAGQLRRELVELKSSLPYHASLYSREITPKAFALFDSLPEFENIGRSLPSYGEGRLRPLSTTPVNHSPDPPQRGGTHPSPYSLPSRLNLLIAAAQAIGLLALLAAASIDSGWALAGLAITYALLMNSGYAMLHEAEHGLLHANRRLNDTVGAILALFFPAPFHLLRQGHIGHHLRNRSDDEAFDFYFEGESRIWKTLQLYGILTGFFYLTVVLSNLLALIHPNLLKARWGDFDRPTRALLDSLNPRYFRLIRIEAIAVFLLHGTWIWLWSTPVWKHLLLVGSFGVLWSALQYVHHFGTERDVLKGARNLRTWKWLDALWLNHNWHRNHHSQPTVPWVDLPKITPENDGQRGRVLAAYLRMWRGPRLTDERIENHHAGKIIR